MPRIIDTHTHVQFPAYDNDRGEVVSRALSKDIWMVNVGTQASTSEAAIQLAETEPEGLYATIGFHPGHIESGHHDEWEKKYPSDEVFNPDLFRRMAHHEKVLAIGECGLDYHRLPADKKTSDEIKLRQKEVFIQQIEIAFEVGKPLVIHCREAFPDLIAILQGHFAEGSGPNGIIHFFSGTPEDMAALSRLGFSFGFGGVVTFASSYQELVIATPLENIVVETDAPYVAPVPYRGKRNEPLYIEATLAMIAAWKGIRPNECAEQTSANARRIFRLK